MPPLQLHRPLGGVGGSTRHAAGTRTPAIVPGSLSRVGGTGPLAPPPSTASLMPVRQLNRHGRHGGHSAASGQPRFVPAVSYVDKETVGSVTTAVEAAQLAAGEETYLCIVGVVREGMAE